MGVTKKKSVPQRIPVKITKKYKNKTGGELICKKFGVNGNWVMFSWQMVSKKAPIVGRKAPTVSQEVPTASKKAPKHTCKQKSQL